MEVPKKVIETQTDSGNVMGNEISVKSIKSLHVRTSVSRLLTLNRNLVLRTTIVTPDPNLGVPEGLSLKDLSTPPLNRSVIPLLTTRQALDTGRNRINVLPTNFILGWTSKRRLPRFGRGGVRQH